jgi:hypothetical protein
MPNKLPARLPGDVTLHQAELLRYAVEVLEGQKLTYMVVGSFASAAYGEPRLTHDIDIVVQLGMENVDRLCEAFPAPEFYVSPSAARDAVLQRGQFNVIHPASGNKIDFMIARDDPWGRSQLARRVQRPVLPDCETVTAAPEDIILAKLWYYQDGGSEKHLRDIASMLRVSGDEIDKSYIERWVSELGFTQEWQAVLERVAHS